MRENGILQSKRRRKKIFAALLLIAALLCLLMIPAGSLFKSGGMENSAPGLEISYAASPDDLRGIWVATVVNLDYPTSPSISKNTLKSQLDDIVKNAESAGFNGIFFQVRPTADSFYPSDIFPWSKYLTGNQGTAPSEGFDPLAYLLEIAHEKNIQVHAWINPYRITKGGDGDFETLSPNHPARKNPDYVVKYTDGNYYFDPGIPGVRDLVTRGVTEIIENYNVDGIHLDDYFYPGSNFPDQETFEKYGAGFANIEDWRRDNVNTLVKSLYECVHQKNPEIAFGISPTGIWANGTSLAEGSDTKGQESYFHIYADSRKWVQNHWVDYIAPQIYWEIGYHVADYQVLVDWWSNTVKNTGVKLYIGMAAYKAGNPDIESPWHGTSEILNQLKLNDGKPSVSGEILFRYGSLSSVPGLKDAVSSYYRDASNGDGNSNGGGNSGVSEPEKPELPSLNFIDLEQTEWAKPYIYRLANQGIVAGKGNGRFDPMASVTRGEYITMLINALELEVSDAFSCTYDDAAPGQWYYSYLAAAQSHGILPVKESDPGASGLTNLKTFKPNEPVSREDMALFTQNAFHALSLSPENPKDFSFLDDASISSQEKREAISILWRTGIIHGYEDQTFRPQGLTTRAEASTLICALLDYTQGLSL